MTRDEIIRIAQEADIEWNLDYSGCFIYDFLEGFAALVAAAEREACAKVCEDIPLQFTHIPTLVGCAAAIRARGNE